jgi:hypothetical protein
MMAGGLLCVGWGIVLVLPKAATKWGAAYMAVMSVAVPFATVFVAR